MATKRTCLYELLGVSRSASTDEIKSAYKKKALEWHPDKNMHQLELAGEMFKEIKQAYSILTDSQERAWYDSHRESILRGATAENGTSEESENADDFMSFNLWPFFSSSCYRGYGDNSEGFYKVYGNVFEEIIKEEYAVEESSEESSEESEEEIEEEPDDYIFSKNNGKKNKTKKNEKEKQVSDDISNSIPRFGNSTSEWNEVDKFYKHWSNFVSRRNYSWMDKYKPSEAENRRVKRIMEKENKKFRDQARKARNELVRHLVEFIKKRDKRIAVHKEALKAKQEEKRKLEEKQKELQILENSKRLAKLKEDHRVLVSELEEELKALDTELIDTIDSDSVENVLICQACGKRFKSEKQWKNHEQSKSHKERIAFLQQDLLLDDEITEDLSSQPIQDPQQDPAQDLVEDNLPKENTQDGADDNKKEKEGEEEEEDSDLKREKWAEKRKKKKQKKKTFSAVSINSDSDDQDQIQSPEVKVSQDIDSTTDEPISSEPLEETKEVKKKAEVQVPVKASAWDSDSDDDRKKKKKGKQAKNKQKAKTKENPKQTPASKTEESTTESNKNSNETIQKQTTTISEFKCSVCDDDFKTRNQLFKHIQSSGHAVPIPDDTKPSKRKTKQK